VDDVEIATENMKKNLHIKTEASSENNTAVVNDSQEQRVPVSQTAAVDNKLPHEEKLSENNDEQSASTSSRPAQQARDSSIKKKAEGSSPQKIVTSKPSGSSPQPQSVKGSSMKKTAPSCNWEDKGFTIQCLEGHNDLISSVDMDGSFLISGRFVMNEFEQNCWNMIGGKH
jgi:hypothetical protein